MKKVLKLSARVETDCVDGSERECVKLNFQYFKDGKPNPGGNVIIYRREEPGYVFDYDESEYFDCMLPNEEDIIFDGMLEVENTFSVYTDRDVEIGRVYVYWVGREAFGKYLTGPVAVKVRDSRVFWSYERIAAAERELIRKHPSVALKQVGSTVLGKDISALLVGNRDNMIACIGAVHAGESGPEILLTLLDEILDDDPNAFDACGIAILPDVNADMRDVMAKGAPWYIRTNAKGVDLNRNFDASWSTTEYGYDLSTADYRSPTYRGPYPHSEPEVRAVVDFIELVKPRALFSFHYLCSVASDKLISSKSAADDNEYKARLGEVKRIYSDAFRDAIGKPRLSCCEPELTSSSGGLATYMYQRGVIAFDLEFKGDVEEFFDCKQDKTTPEILDLAIRGHKAALLKIIDFYG